MGQNLVDKPEGGSVPLVSFVVPLYNKEEYIQETLESIYACDYPSKEVIVVDDCSTDASLGIAEAYLKQFDNYNLIRLPRNVGLSSARNAGLQVAKGRYIQFWDADDIYSKTTLLKLVKLSEELGSDVVTAVAEREGVVLENHKEIQKFLKNTSLLESLCLFHVPSSTFKLYRKSFLTQNNLRFLDGAYIQDQDFNFRTLSVTHKITMTPYVLGEYRAAKNASSQLVNERKAEAPIIIAQSMLAHLEANKLYELRKYCEAFLLRTTFGFFIRRMLDCNYKAWDVYAKKYLPIYSELMCRYISGIELLFETAPPFSLCILAVICKNYKLSRKIFYRSAMTQKEMSFLEVEVDKYCKFDRDDVFKKVLMGYNNRHRNSYFKMYVKSLIKRWFLRKF